MGAPSAVASPHCFAAEILLTDVPVKLNAWLRIGELGRPPPSPSPSVFGREFQRALGYRGRTSQFVERIFALFDGNGDKSLTFPEFIKGIALLSPNGTVKEKTKCTCGFCVAPHVFFPRPAP